MPCPAHARPRARSPATDRPRKRPPPAASLHAIFFSCRTPSHNGRPPSLGKRQAAPGHPSHHSAAISRLADYHLDSPKFTKFDDFEPLERQDAAAARQSEEAGLSAVESFTYELDGLKIDVFGEAAIATFVFHYQFDAEGNHVALRARATMVFVSDGTTWKIAHEHFSPFAANGTA